MRSIVLALIVLLALSACQHTAKFTPVGERCNLVRYSLETPLPDEPPLRSILADNPGDMLLLSGGSQDGAFGAGFIDGWHDSGTMPEFKLVTGISTGALQATGAFIGQPEIAIKGYTIDGEGQLLETYVSGSQVNPELSLGAGVTLLRRGAIADLIPLRARLKELLTPEVLEAVGARYDRNGRGAHLLVGATDVDLGTAVAFDMTELAARYRNAPRESAARDHLKDCYVEALVASSIVPPAARPVFIDNRMYIDGGVRYAVFDDRVGEILNDMLTARTALPEAQRGAMPGLYMILNHTGESRAVCRKEEEDDCRPINSTIGPREDWEVLDLAVRTLELFEGQVRRLSVARAEERASANKMPFYFARIRAEDLTDPRRTWRIPDFSGEKTCANWELDDDADENPIEFHKRYMRCLIAYGRERGLRADWDRSSGG